ncbi:hypothetical protein ACFPL7_04470 [Dongia soli]|uniref:Uncharacterized protein n=1 Tax=Dongia soli TaxID=600628 RepID=A0ABU5EH97_9PROT|nr:hypothetical protein [Dongia soli]MDY0885805.1 hypothetical protein [Dongia soli]
MKTRIIAFLTAPLAFVLGQMPAEANDYPTPVVADYVIGCMASNGNNQEMMQRCSCSIDAISSIVPYDTYEKADTIIRMRMVPGDNTAMFRDMPMLKAVVDQLRLAQIEADFRCF